jgi:hypothetical protein
MRSQRWLSTRLVCGVCAAAALGGCGSSATKTVTVANAPTASTSTTTTAKTSSTSNGASTQTSTTPAHRATTAPSAPASTTHTAPEPAFTHTEGGPADATSAAAVVREHGYTPNNTSEYHANQTLRVLVGTRTGSADGYDQRAFFFLDGRYIGTDTKEASATVKVLSQGETEVTLAYPLYRPGDPLGSPSGGQATVRFQLNDGKLAPLATIPPASSSSGLSRN